MTIKPSLGVLSTLSNDSTYIKKLYSQLFTKFLSMLKFVLFSRFQECMFDVTRINENLFLRTTSTYTFTLILYFFCTACTYQYCLVCRGSWASPYLVPFWLSFFILHTSKKKKPHKDIKCFCLWINFFIINFRQHATRVDFSIPLRESFALPFLYMQILFICFYLKQNVEFISKVFSKPSSNINVCVSSKKLIMFFFYFKKWLMRFIVAMTTIYCLCWQFGPFILFIQSFTVFVLYVISVIDHKQVIVACFWFDMLPIFFLISPIWLTFNFYRINTIICRVITIGFFSWNIIWVFLI